MPEFEVTKAIIPDNEYDWGRKGANCATCNYGKGNSRWAFTDQDGNLWLNDIDPHTGLYIPSNGHGLLIDTNTAPVADFGNGPEWMISSAGSQVVYTRYLDGVPHSTDSAQIAVATQQPDGSWTTRVLANSLGRATPEGTQVENDPDPRINYIKADKTALYWRKMSEPDVEHEMPISQLTGGNSRRWVPGTHKIIFQGHLATDPTLVDQVFTFDTDTNTLEQLTFDEVGKYGGFMFRAPEFNNEYVFFTMANFRQEIRIYRKLIGSDGVARWTLIKTVTGPSALPFFFSPEPFVHNGRSYVFTTVNSSPKFFDHSIPTQLAITGIDPLNADFRMLTNSTTPYRLRLDPEFFILDDGPYIYYNRLVPATDTYPDGVPDGIWRVNTGLGPRLP